MLDAEAARIAWLIAGFLRGTLTPKEHRELDDWVGLSDEHMRLFEELTDETASSGTLSPAEGRPSPAPLLPENGGRRLVRRAALPLAAAAVLLLVLFTVWWLPRPFQPKAPQAEEGVPPPGTMALLTAGSGQAIALLAGRDTSLTLKGGSRLQSGPEGISYPAGGTQPLSTTLHTLRTLPGRTCRLRLSDGTAVWLNAGSRLTYPAAFGAGRREVTLRGEAYFEVRHDPARPFSVRSGGLLLQVLGTSFNVEAYTQEVSTTLVEGRVQVSRAADTTILAAGEQLRAAAQGPFRKTARADVAAALGWQSGLFVFRDASLETVLAQLARWYDVVPSLSDTVPFHFTATIPRDLPLERVLAILELTGKVRFSLDGSTLRAEGVPAPGP